MVSSRGATYRSSRRSPGKGLLDASVVTDCVAISGSAWSPNYISESSGDEADAEDPIKRIAVRSSRGHGNSYSITKSKVKGRSNSKSKGVARVKGNEYGKEYGNEYGKDYDYESHDTIEADGHSGDLTYYKDYLSWKQTHQEYFSHDETDDATMIMGNKTVDTTYTSTQTESNSDTNSHFDSTCNSIFDSDYSYDREQEHGHTGSYGGSPNSSSIINDSQESGYVINNSHSDGYSSNSLDRVDASNSISYDSTYNEGDSYSDNNNNNNNQSNTTRNTLASMNAQNNINISINNLNSFPALLSDHDILMDPTNSDSIDMDLMRSKLRKLCHAATCTQTPCPTERHCFALRRVFAHMQSCRGPCAVPGCKKNRLIWAHYRQCMQEEGRCYLCKGAPTDYADLRMCQVISKPV